eukprot:TRINITY_DN26339_c0_g1_i1.p2 TRINITY_DN26339_c0_g1~~TRINITY_DN26339_c0_g1_i1.p2  ORF type:complete len:123 (+),score=7.91 TRINITY_DN26339_c0_g1_i1:232-600(+)
MHTNRTVDCLCITSSNNLFPDMMLYNLPILPKLPHMCSRVFWKLLSEVPKKKEQKIKTEKYAWFSISNFIMSRSILPPIPFEMIITSLKTLLVGCLFRPLMVFECKWPPAFSPIFPSLDFAG